MYNPDTLAPLNLSECEDEPITISTPKELSEELKETFKELQESGYNMFDKYDKFYTDICTPFTSSDKTDIPLNDRFNDYYFNNEIKCASGCEFEGYNFNSSSLNCKCNVLNSNIDLSKLKKGQDEGKDSLYKSFFEVLKYSNYKVLTCFKLAFNSNIFSYNYGHYIVLGYFFFYFISFCGFIIKGLEPIIIHIPQELICQSVLDEIPPKTRNMKKIKVNANNLNSKNNTNDNDTKSKFRTTTIIKKSKKNQKN